MGMYTTFPNGGFQIRKEGYTAPAEWNGHKLPSAELPGLSEVVGQDNEYDRPTYRMNVYMNPETGEDMFETVLLRGYGTDSADPHCWNTNGGSNEGSDPLPDEGDQWSNPDKTLMEAYNEKTSVALYLSEGRYERAERFIRLVEWIRDQENIKKLNKGYWSFRKKVDQIYKARRNGGHPGLNGETAGKLTSSQIRTIFALFRAKMVELNKNP